MSSGSRLISGSQIAVSRIAWPDLGRDLYRIARKSVLQRVIKASTRPADLSVDAVIEVVGYHSINAGIAESARLCAASLDQAGYRVRVVDLGSAGKSESADAGLRIWHLNPPMMPRAVMKFGLRRFRSAFNIGYWAWELERLPAEWIAATAYMNAFFVPSDFIRATLARATPKPVSCVPHPCPAADSSGIDIRAELGIGKRAFIVATVFNFSSSLGRKNPIAAVKAFQKAFSGSEDVTLVIKTSGRVKYPEDAHALQYAIQSDHRIKWIDATWEMPRVTALLGASNTYISLHRSEGFGLTLAEAMRAGCPVICTGWSGNVDFCNADTSYPVPYSLVPLRDAHPDYRDVQGARWAEPDTDAAAKLLRQIFAHPAEAERKARAAKVYFDGYVSARSYGAALKDLAGGAA